MPTYQNLFPDARLDARADQIATAMAQQQSAIIRRITETRSEAAGAYRFFSNPNVALEALETALYRHCHALTEGGHKLVLQDTTQLNFEHLRERLGAEHGLGVIGDDESLGCFLHPSLVVDAETGYCLGLSNVELWTRPEDRPDSPDKQPRAYKRRPIEAKESFRWIKSIAASQAVLEKADHVTMVADREGDIFEVGARVPEAHTDLVVRAQTNRRIAESPGLLYEHVGQQQVAGTYTIEVRADPRRGRPARQAKLVVRHAPVHLRRPDRLAGSDYPEAVALHVVEASEQPESVPQGKAPICWRLLTSHAVEDFEAARQIIAWYQQRWHIEQYFRLLKRQGLNLEQAQLESGAALKRLCLMAAGAALQVLRLVLVRQGPHDQPARHVFTDQEQDCIAALVPEWEGTTVKQQNPHGRGTLAWASWLIARLGGWKGYASQRPPGPITYYRGMYRFASIYQGWKLAHP